VHQQPVPVEVGSEAWMYTAYPKCRPAFDPMDTLEQAVRLIIGPDAELEVDEKAS
jgi:hypothetical protein